jgi:hypothetical protein
VVIILTVSKLSYFVSKLTGQFVTFVLIGILFEMIEKSLKNLNMTTGKSSVPFNKFRARS